MTGHVDEINNTPVLLAQPPGGPMPSRSVSLCRLGLSLCLPLSGYPTPTCLRPFMDLDSSSTCIHEPLSLQVGGFSSIESSIRHIRQPSVQPVHRLSRTEANPSGGHTTPSCSQPPSTVTVHSPIMINRAATGVGPTSVFREISKRLAALISSASLRSGYW